jgi:hypothetical protein
MADGAVLSGFPSFPIHSSAPIEWVIYAYGSKYESFHLDLLLTRPLYAGRPSHSRCKCSPESRCRPAGTNERSNNKQRQGAGGSNCSWERAICFC